jgi:hypothetical protein
MDKAKVDTFIAALECPTQITWSDIQKLFTQMDIDHMKRQRQPIDLSSYEDVSKPATAKAIYHAVSTGYMPRDEDRWSQKKCDTFGCWIQQGYKR